MQIWACWPYHAQKSPLCKMEVNYLSCRGWAIFTSIWLECAIHTFWVSMMNLEINVLMIHHNYTFNSLMRKLMLIGWYHRYYIHEWKFAIMLWSQFKWSNCEYVSPGVNTTWVIKDNHSGYFMTWSDRVWAKQISNEDLLFLTLKGLRGPRSQIEGFAIT